jgi:hypothetical protein
VTASRYDRDPDALAWARAKVQHHLDRLVKFEQQADIRGDTDKARGLAIARRSTEQLLIGGQGCVIAAFDARLPEWTACNDAAEPLAPGGSRP